MPISRSSTPNPVEFVKLANRSSNASLLKIRVVLTSLCVTGFHSVEKHSRAMIRLRRQIQKKGFVALRQVCSKYYTQ